MTEEDFIIKKLREVNKANVECQADLKRKMSQIFVTVNGEQEIRPDITPDQLSHVFAQLKEMKQKLLNIQESQALLKCEHDEAIAHSRNTRNNMIALEEDFSRRLGEKVQIFPEYLRFCYHLDD
jgi:hypothetical protein